VNYLIIVAGVLIVTIGVVLGYTLQTLVNTVKQRKKAK